MNELCRIHTKLSDCFPGSEAFCREMSLGGIAIMEDRDQVDDFTVVISDDPAYLASFHGHVCCLLAERPCQDERPWQAWPVVMNLSDLTPSFIRLMLCHHRGDPYTIAETQRLLIRESCPDDYEKLCELAGEHSTMASREQFEAYIHLAYRFFGYGFWSVIDKTDGDVVGWCGFYPEAPHEAAEEPAESVRDRAQESVIALSDVETEKTQEIEEIVIAMSDVETGKTQEIEEMSPEPASEEALCLGYAIREPYRGKGYASESCRAVMRYGMEELGITVLHLWVKQDNGPSVRLASRLGFHLVRSGDLCLYEWREHESGI